MKRLPLLVAVVALVAGAPVRAGSSNEDAGQSIAAILAENVRPDGPGCIVGMASGRSKIFVARGMASIEWRQPITEQTVFEIASNSKQFTAALIYQLAGEGKLDLGRRAGDYLPDLKGKSADATVSQLLSHTSGIRDVDSLRMLTRTQDEVTPTTEDALAAIYSQSTVNFDPGSDFAYSNSNYILLARILELVENEPFAKILTRRISGPMHLTGTFQRIRYDDVVPMRAMPYGGSLDDPVTQIPNWVLAGTSSIQSTAPDLLRWLEEVEQAGSGKGVPPGMGSPGQLADGRMLAYAGGLVRDTIDGHERLTHNGGSGGFRSTLAIYPGQRLSLAVLCNSSAIYPNVIADSIARRFLPPSTKSAKPTGEKSDLEGVFYDSRADAIRWIEDAEGGLLVRTSLRDPGRLFRPLGDGAYADRFGNTLLLGRSVMLDDGLRYLRTLDRVDAGASQSFPANAVGRYRSPDLDVRISILADSTGPYLRLEPTEPFMRSSDTIESRLTPVPTGAFMTGNGWIVRFPREGLMTLSLGRLNRYPLGRIEEDPR